MTEKEFRWVRFLSKENLTEDQVKACVKLFMDAESNLFECFSYPTIMRNLSDEALLKLQYRYNKIFINHVIPILFHLLIDYNIEYNDYDHLVKLIKSVNLEEPTELDYTNSLRSPIDIAYNKVNDINIEVEDLIMKEFNKEYSIPDYRLERTKHSWKTHPTFI